MPRGHSTLFLFCLYRNPVNPGLERVSVVGVTTHNGENDSRPLKQSTLIKFVRNTPTLTWLRSDLTDENIAMLRKERPEVTFVSA